MTLAPSAVCYKSSPLCSLRDLWPAEKDEEAESNAVKYREDGLVKTTMSTRNKPTEDTGD